MTPRYRAMVRGVVVTSGIIVTLAGVFAFRLADWPIYIVFALVSVVLFLPYVEVLPRLPLPIPEMAATIGFLYIGGLPIIALRNLAPVLTRALSRALPPRWRELIPQLRGDPFAAAGPTLHVNAGVVADWATFSLGLAVRWWIASTLAPDGRPAHEPWAMAAAELGGYTCWGLLSLLPIYSYRPFLPPERRLRAALTDIGLIVMLALTPFVFLIAYGFQKHGLSGAAGWSLSALGLHFMLKRLNERRLTVEEQNRRLEALNRELEHRERLSAIGKMSSVVSHQILQQLGVIGIYADLIHHADAAGDALAALAQTRQNALAIEGALGDVNRVLTDLLVFSKDLRVNLYEHPLARVLDECLSECRAEATARRVTLRAQCPEPLTVTLDKLKIKQAIVNVLRNAVEASPPASEVCVHAGISDGVVEVAVSDSGPGVPERDREAVFTPFFTTKEHGTGLGLAIARAFTEAHGGQLTIEASHQTGGATFIFRLPLTPASATPPR